MPAFAKARGAGSNPSKFLRLFCRDPLGLLVSSSHTLHSVKAEDWMDPIGELGKIVSIRDYLNSTRLGKGKQGMKEKHHVLSPEG